MIKNESQVNATEILAKIEKGEDHFVVGLTERPEKSEPMMTTDLASISIYIPFRYF